MEDMSFFYAAGIFLISCGFSTVFTFRQGSVLFSRIRLRRRFASVTISLAVRKVRTNAFLFRQILRSQVPRRRAEPQSFLFQRSLPMNISYDSYRVFYYAAKYRSFSQAAAALYSNQPNVTRMIRKLESELGCALFFRSPQGVRLTPEGEKLYTHIAVAFESIEAGEEEVLSDQSLQSGIVHIAASSLALRTRLLQVLARYRRAYPHVRICLTNHSASHGLAAVQNGLADFAILAEGASVPDSLTAQKIDEIQEIPICGPAFLELTEEPVSLKRLADYPIISLTEGTSSHDFYAELFLRHGLSFSPDVEVETTAQVPPVVQSDLGVGFVPREMLYGTPEASGIYPIMLEEPIPARSVFLFQRKTQPLSIAAKKLRQMLLEDAPQESGK
jgi:transcriptional regulator